MLYYNRSKGVGQTIQKPCEVSRSGEIGGLWNEGWKSPLRYRGWRPRIINAHRCRQSAQSKKSVEAAKIFSIFQIDFFLISFLFPFFFLWRSPTSVGFLCVWPRGHDRGAASFCQDRSFHKFCSNFLCKLPC